MQRTFYSGHLSIADIIFRSQLTLPPRTDLSIEDTSNIKHFFQETSLHFTLDNVLQFWLGFLRFLLFLDCKFVGISSPYSSLWLTCFPFAKIFKAQWDGDRNMDTIMEISVVHGEPLLLYSEN